MAKTVYETKISLVARQVVAHVVKIILIYSVNIFFSIEAHGSFSQILTDSSIKSTLNKRPSPLEFDHVLILDFDVTRAHIVHLEQNI